jgi:cytidylate kinase
VVFPDAQLKFYLDASPQERARRRVKQLRDRGEIVDYNQILSEIVTRDQRDSSRKVGPLAVPRDAQVIDTTLMSEDQVIARLVAMARKLQKQPRIGS